jgi:hypothetical protein
MTTFRDPLFARQWHFKLLGDIGTVWNEYSGAGVHVGVYDDGLQYTHPDLNDRYDASLHFVYNGTVYDPNPINLTDDAHGTSVAGLIAGEAGNRIGGVGVAWGASITGVNVLSDPAIADPEVLLAAYRHAASFDIMSNSWGYDPLFDDFLNRSDPESEGSATVDAFTYAVETGRNGLGTIIVKAAGNEATNANGEGINGSRTVVSVAALTTTGAVTDYSNFGSNILVAAGAASVTTDLIGSGGYNAKAGAAGDYTSDFGGTSAATPVVSGVVALMLDANENLGWRDVREILATSAALTGSVIGTKAPDETTPFSSQNTGTWNGGGHAISNDYGYGRVDAFAAVRMAEAWSLWSDTPETSANEITQSITTEGTGFAGIPLLDSQAVQLQATEAMWIDHVDVTVTLNFSAINQQTEYLDLFVYAPDGTRFRVFSTDDINLDTGEVLNLQDGLRWTFGVAHAIGLNALGTWTFDIVGQAGASLTGAITSVSYDFFGRAWDTSGDDVHHITKDFLTVTSVKAAGWNGGRDRVLSDTNGGVDWVDMSSIAGAVTITLDANGKISVAGKQWAIFDAVTQIENLVTGDGADKITGSALANEIHAMRGNDAVYGLGGADTLQGGAGNDQLFGGSDGDLLDGGAGADKLDGGSGNDTVFGGAGDDTYAEKTDGGDDVVTMGQGRDKVLLGAGNDTFIDDAETGRNGADTASGGAGNDTLLGAGGADKLSGDAGDDRLTGGEGADTLAGGLGNDTAEGGDGNDSLTGDSGDDQLFGDMGQDKLLGGAGADTLTGGAGNDSLTGGLDADTFVFGAGFGADRISDFKDNIDTLAFDASLWGDITDAAQFVSTFARVVGGAVVFDLHDGNMVTVTGIRSLAALYDDLILI